MRVRARLEKLQLKIGERPPPGQLDLVVAVPVGSEMADDLPPGIHFNVDGRVAMVVYDGEGPDAAVLAAVQGRLTPWGLTIMAASETGHVPPDNRTA